MTANDPGHINNLDANQKVCLQRCWARLINVICDKYSLSVDEIAESSCGEILFGAVGRDNPDVVLLRWLRSNKWSVERAVKKLMETLQWRQRWNINQLIKNGESELNIKELIAGKACILGKDREGRPLTYVQVKNHIIGVCPIESSELFTIYILETARKLLDHEHETGTLVLDMEDFSLKNADFPLVKFLISLLETHYPESLAMLFVINASILVHTCWNIIKNWLDSEVLRKIHFLTNVDQLTRFIDPSILPRRSNANESSYFKYIPPAADDEKMLIDIRNDRYGEKKAQKAHRSAAKHYFDLTLQWASSGENIAIANERKVAAERLRSAYERLIPYVSTRTQFHRMGIIDEPIFEIVYKQILQREREKIVMF